MPEKITYITQTDLLERIQTDRSSFASLWENLSDTQMTERPGPQNDWSVKDLIAHIVWWENTVMSRVKNILAGKDATRSETIDEINERVFQENKDRELSIILSEFNANLPKLESLISRLSDEQINDPNLVNIKDRALRDYLIGDTFGHYDMHREDLQHFVESFDN